MARAHTLRALRRPPAASRSPAPLRSGRPGRGRTPPDQRGLCASVPAALLVLATLVTASHALPGPAPRPQSAPAPAPADPKRGRLVVFVQPAVSPVAEAFEAGTLPGLVALADELGVTVTVLDVAAGAPAEVHLTPLLVYQNHRGRSIYQGRSADLDRVRTFLRTARLRPQGSDELTQHDVPVRRLGRATLTSPLKVGSVTGSLLDGDDEERFLARALAAIRDALDAPTWATDVGLGRSDRSFYFDFYPYRADDGTLYLSTALYSQFHCKQPVYRTPGDAPFTGSWEDRDELFGQAAADLERALAEQVRSAERGDGFDPVPASTALVDWASLGLSLPASPPDAPPNDTSVELPTRWVLDDPSPEAGPALLFHLPAPLDSYRGEVTDLTGRLDLSGTEAAGRVQAAAGSVTMGDPDLDRWIHGAAVLLVAEHPEATFELGVLEPTRPTLRWGVPTPVTGRGSFTMRGLAVDLRVRAQLEPVVAEDGTPRLLASGTFSIPLAEAWAVEVPVGEPPANETLVFEFDFELR